jgi:sulfatase modifying factor 1
VVRWFLLLMISASAVWAQPLVTPTFVEIGDPGNSGTWSTGPYGGQYVGEVAYQFRMGKFEVTNDEYAAFLNAVELGGGNAWQLYDSRMGTDPRGGIAWVSSAPSGSRFVARTNMGNKPVNFVSHYDAARFCNWLHNGATTGSSTETGAYTLSGATSGVLQRNPGALFWVPNSSEWFKAGYYKGGGTSAGYWLYPTSRAPTGSNEPGQWTAKSNGDANTTPASNVYHWENFNSKADWNGQDGNVGSVGTFSGPSAYGTFDQGGNVSEMVIDGHADGNNDYVRGGNYGTPLSTGLGYLMGRSYLAGFKPQVLGEPTRGFRIAAVTAVTPSLVVRDQNQTALVSPAAATNAPVLVAPLGNSTFLFSIHNIGGTALTNVDLSISGEHSADFSLSQTTISNIAPLSSVSVSCTFTPGAAGTRSAQLSIASNDPTNSPFVINLAGYGLSESTDYDSDGLNDAAEFTMSDLGFNWEVAQPSLVNVLYTSANRANLYSELQYNANRTNGQTDVTANPAAFNLFTQSQFDGNRSAGQQDVIASPMAYGLYDSNSIMDLRMGGLMIQKQGTDATIVFQSQTTTDLATLPFTNNGTPITNTVPMPGDKGFLRVEAIYVPAGDLP